MTGWRILKHSIGMLWRNFGIVMRISLVLVILSFAVKLGLKPWIASHAVAPIQRDPLVAFVLLQIPALLSMIIWAWIAVNWHRFILLNERPKSWVPTLRGNNIFMYLLWIIILVTICILFLTPLISLVLALFRSSLAAGFRPNTAEIVLIYGLCIFVFLLVVVVMMRLSPVFVSRSLGEKVGLREAWRLTEGASGSIFSIFIIVLIFLAALTAGWMAVLTFFTSLIMSMIFVILPIYLALVWLSGMLLVSVMTTFYGVCVEKRELWP